MHILLDNVTGARTQQKQLWRRRATEQQAVTVLERAETED
jgi:hypothetical protein